jgi:hypothetical protein
VIREGSSGNIFKENFERYASFDGALKKNFRGEGDGNFNVGGVDVLIAQVE